MLTALAISGYRSIRNMVVPLQRLNLITGANGSGKSSLYRAMRLLADTAQGNIVQSLAREGGLPSTLWAGPEVITPTTRRGDHPLQGAVKQSTVSLRLGFASDEFSYLIDLGMPAPAASRFPLDPDIKRECIWHGGRLRPSAMLMDRRGPVVRFRQEEHDWEIAAQNLSGFDSIMARMADPRRAPEVLVLRDFIRSWRFYDQFRTDAEAPVRSPQVGTWTPVLGNDGSDLAAALATIQSIPDTEALGGAIEDAFPNSRVWVENANGRFTLKMQQPGLLRPLEAAELSDGTLRYLLWVAVLLTPRPPGLMVLNEPETSLHPDLLPALARLIARASNDTQVIVVSHAARLIEGLGEQAGCNSIRLEKEFGETTAPGSAGVAWTWPGR